MDKIQAIAIGRRTKKHQLIMGLIVGWNSKMEGKCEIFTKSVETQSERSTQKKQQARSSQINTIIEDRRKLCTKKRNFKASVKPIMTYRGTIWGQHNAHTRITTQQETTKKRRRDLGIIPLKGEIMKRVKQAIARMEHHRKLLLREVTNTDNRGERVALL